MPGVNPETIYAGINGAEVDVRDAKIIQLAKKARNYTVALASEREKNRKLALDFERLKIDATALAKELKARGPLDPDAARYPFQENQAPVKEAPVMKASQRERRVGVEGPARLELLREGRRVDLQPLEVQRKLPVLLPFGS